MTRSDRTHVVVNIVGGVLVVAACAAAVAANWLYASHQFLNPRLRIVAVTGRPLSAGRVLQKEDLLIRLRRPELHQDQAPREYFDSATVLVGRQLDAKRGGAVRRGDILYEDLLAQPSGLRADPVDIALPLERTAAMQLGRNARVIVVPQGQQQTAMRSWPELVTLDCLDPAAIDKDTVTLKLRAPSTGAAMQILNARTADVKLVPLVLSPGEPCKPPATKPPKKKK